MAVCVSIVEASLDEAVRAIESARQSGADMVEVRFDRMAKLPEDLTPLKGIEIPKIATLRSKAHGGSWEGEDGAKLKFLRRAARAGLMIDLEDDSPLLRSKDRELRGAELIISHHDFESTPPPGAVIETVLSNAARGGVPKGAFQVNSVTDLHGLVRAGKLLALTGHRFALLGMGELGTITRLRYQRMGCYYTYAALEPGKEAAPGQLDLATVKAMEKGIVTGITGQPLGHSLSPALHHAAFAHLGIAGRYLSFPASSDELGLLMDLVRDLGINGLNVTIPHKEAVMEHLDEIDATAQRVGAVNVIVNRDGRLVGRNTDLTGLAQAFKAAGAEVGGKEALIVGAGGAARACAAFLQQAGAHITVANRTPSHAEAVARDFGGRAIGLEDAPTTAFDVVVNCTPVGMEGFPPGLPVAAEVFRPDQVVMDMVYAPERTAFLAEAEARGAKTIPGREMLIYQAMDSFEAWTGQKPPYEVMAGAVRSEQG